MGHGCKGAGQRPGGHPVAAPPLDHLSVRMVLSPGAANSALPGLRGAALFDPAGAPGRGPPGSKTPAVLHGSNSTCGPQPRVLLTQRGRLRRGAHHVTELQTMRPTVQHLQHNSSGASGRPAT